MNLIRVHLRSFAAKRVLLPRRINRFADQERRVSPRPRPEFLYTAAVYFGDIEIAFLIDAEAMHAPECASSVAPDAPRIQEVSLQIVLQHLRGAAIGGP